MKNIPVILLGCGGVGKQLLQHIVNCRSLHAIKGLVLRVVGVCDSKSLLVPADFTVDHFSDEFLLEICRFKSSSSSSSSASRPLSALRNSNECHAFEYSESMEKIIDIARRLSRSTGLVIVDCTASSETIGILSEVVNLGCCIVLANKKPLTATMEQYEKLILHPRRIRHESTVGAGLPVITSLNRILASGDPIRRVIGSLSGTLGYVMSEVAVGKPFSEVVKAAKCLGYTEPDPRDDLSGMDVARKALILARLLGLQINLEDIKIESLYPEKMGPEAMSTEDFLVSGLPFLDKDIETRTEIASSHGNVLRYVCVIEEACCLVGIKEVPKDSALGRLRGSDNVLEIYSRCYEKLPLVIQGAGAGNDTTAAGVLADIIDLQEHFSS